MELFEAIALMNSAYLHVDLLLCFVDIDICTQWKANIG